MLGDSYKSTVGELYDVLNCLYGGDSYDTIGGFLGGDAYNTLDGFRDGELYGTLGGFRDGGPCDAISSSLGGESYIREGGLCGTLAIEL